MRQDQYHWLTQRFDYSPTRALGVTQLGIFNVECAITTKNTTN